MAGWGYDVVGALDATPGTEELREVAARVERVDTGALADLGRRYASLADGMDTSLRAVADGGDGVGRAWQGPGADAFARYAADFARAGSGTGDAARRIQGELAGLGRTLAALREEVAGHVSDALDLARQRPDQVRTAVATPTARARSALDRAEQEVADCARRLRDIADGVSGFSRLRSPDAGVMSAAGATSRWTDRQGAVIGADEPAQAARILDGGSSGSEGDDGGSSGSKGDDGGSRGSVRDGDPDAGNGAEATDTGAAERESGGTASDEGRGTRADAADPGNAGRYGSEPDSSGAGDEQVDGADDRGGDDTDDRAGSAGGRTGDGDAATVDGGEADDRADSAADEADRDQDDDRGGRAGGQPDNDGDDQADGDEDKADGDDQADDQADADADADDQANGDEDKTDDAANGDDDYQADPTPPAAGSETGTAPSSGRGGVQDWIRQATAILAENGVDPDKMRAADIATIIEHESGGDPDAVNNWDSNADKGTPSKGLMQTIGPTFEANKLPGHDEITDPVDNIIAAVRYAIRRYGSVSEVPGVEAVARGDSYVGY